MPSKLTPVNKYLVIEKQIPQKPMVDRPFLVPDKITVSRHSTVKLKSTSEGSQFEKYIGQNMVIVTGMLEEIDTKGDKHHIIPENAVVAIITESELF
jgi:hypothetical protein